MKYSVLKLLCRKDVISTGVSRANAVEKSGLATMYPDFSTSAASQPALEMTGILSFLQNIFYSKNQYSEYSSQNTE